jgi:hypothetical protein
MFMCVMESDADSGQELFFVGPTDWEALARVLRIYDSKSMARFTVAISVIASEDELGKHYLLSASLAVRPS